MTKPEELTEKFMTTIIRSGLYGSDPSMVGMGFEIACWTMVENPEVFGQFARLYTQAMLGRRAFQGPGKPPEQCLALLVDGLRSISAQIGGSDDLDG